jgi:IrrE N-terminal-like domain
MHSRKWISPSVARFSGAEDPITCMQDRASGAALEAMQEGWEGPPFDPFRLAEIRRIPVVPNCEVLDARTVPLKSGRVQIEYNPNQSRARARFSVAHEIAHTLFPDCSERIRNRVSKAEVTPDEWEVEMLCNLGAAELLMPTGSLAGLEDEDLSMESVLDRRRQFEVSTESVLLRLMHVTRRPYLMFAHRF